jgi:FKBP-type peptidyl-prolyl cis-trans isomerase SlyD
MAKNEVNIVQKDVVVTLDYTLEVNGQEVDSGPIQFIQGHGNIIPGLETQIEGMKLGEEKKVLVKAQDAYGDYDSDLEFDVSRTSFPEDFEIKLGHPMRIQDEAGRIYTGIAIAITDDSVRLNLNHPLAGKDLHFQTSVKDLRMATDEEIQHGHLANDCSGCSSDGCSGCD